MRSAVLLLGAGDLYAAEEPEHIEQKPQYTRTRELPALKISFTDMQSTLDKAANLLSAANVNRPKKKEFYFHETLTLGTGPDHGRMRLFRNLNWTWEISGGV